MGLLEEDMNQTQFAVKMRTTQNEISPLYAQYREEGDVWERQQDEVRITTPMHDRFLQFTS